MDSAPATIKVNPTQVCDLLGHPVDDNVMQLLGTNLEPSIKGARSDQEKGKDMEGSRRPSVSLAIAKVTNDAEDGGLSIEFTTKQV